MKSKLFFLGFGLVVLSGCGPYELRPLGMNHPANAQAMAAPALPSSKTLAYSRMDMPAVSTVSTQQDDHQSHNAAIGSSSENTVAGEGKVIATVPGANQVVLEHGAISGFMDAMTMGYRVEPSSLLEGLKSGDQVRFTIDVPKKTIIRIEKMK